MDSTTIFDTEYNLPIHKGGVDALIPGSSAYSHAVLVNGLMQISDCGKRRSSYKKRYYLFSVNASIKDDDDEMENII